MVEFVVAPTTLQAGDAAVVNRSGSPAMVFLKDAATKAAGLLSTDVAAGNRGLPAGGTTGQALVKTSVTDYAVEWGDAAGGLTVISDDLTPSLGGDLDPDGHVIIGYEIGSDIQAYSAALEATTASFTTALETKLNALPTAADLSTSLGAKANAANSSLSGTPTAPTAAPGTSNTQIANTAFVAAALIAAGASGLQEQTEAILAAGSTALEDYQEVLNLILADGSGDITPAQATHHRAETSGFFISTPQSMKEGRAIVPLTPASNLLSIDGTGFIWAKVAAITANLDINSVSALSRLERWLDVPASGAARTVTFSAFTNKGNVGSGGVSIPDGDIGRFGMWSDGTDSYVWFQGFLESGYVPSPTRAIENVALEAAKAVVSITGSGEKDIAVDANTSYVYITPTGGNMTIDDVTGLVAGQVVNIFLKQDTSNRTVSLAAGTNCVLLDANALDMPTGSGSRTRAVLIGDLATNGTTVVPSFRKWTGPN